MLKKFLFLSSLLTLLLTGCGEKIFISGEYYTILTPEEEKSLIEFARLTVMNSPEKFPPSAKSIIRFEQPKYRIDYNGDKSGRAIFEWKLSKVSAIRLRCEGEFFTNDMTVETKYTHLTEQIAPDKDKKIQGLELKQW